MKAFEAIKTDRIETVCMSLTLDTRRLNESLPVSVRVNSNRRTYYYRTGLLCTLEEWDKLCKANGKGASKLTSAWKTKESQIAIYDRVKETITNLINKGTFTLELLKSQLTGRSDKSFSDVWLSIIEKKKAGTKEAYKYAYASFTQYAGKNVQFDRISPELIEGWEAYMKKNGCGSTTIGMYTRAIRVAIRECIKTGLVKEVQYPFGKKCDGKITIQKGKKRISNYINIDTIKSLMNFTPPIGGKWNEQYRSNVRKGIDMWIFSYLANGMNMADIALLTYDEYHFQSGEKELRFIRRKTQDRTEEVIEIIIPIIDEVRAIINKWGVKPELNKRIFPWILGEEPITDTIILKRVRQENKNVLERIQAACKELGIPQKISMTWSRHSFATNALQAGVPKEYISAAMGHSIKSTTDLYIGLYPMEQRAEYSRMLLQDNNNTLLMKIKSLSKEELNNLLSQIEKQGKENIHA